MTPEVWKMNLELVIGQARVLSMVDIPDMLDKIERADSFGSILDPTLYREKHDAMMQDKELLKAALPMYRWAKKMQALAEGKTP